MYTYLVVGGFRVGLHTSSSSRYQHSKLYKEALVVTATGVFLFVTGAEPSFDLFFVFHN